MTAKRPRGRWRLRRHRPLRVAVLSCDRMPSSAEGPGGLGRSVHEIASGLAARGHDVTLVAAPGSEFASGRLLDHEGWNDGSAIEVFDAIVDSTHEHDLSRRLPNAPVVNRVGDRECAYRPPNPIVGSPYMQQHYPGARLVRAGVDPRAAPLQDGGEHLVYLGLIVEHKGYRTAAEMAAMSGRSLVLAGPDPQGMAPPGHIGELRGDDVMDFLGGALALVAPYTIDAAPRTPLEAALVGTPTICLDGDGTKHHVCDGVSGSVCHDVDSMAAAVERARTLDRSGVRRWVLSEHHRDATIDEVERAVYDVASGRRW